MSAPPTLQEIDRIHDSQPDHAAKGLRALADAGVPPDEVPRFSWLVNHVIGEQQDRWAESWSILQTAAGGSNDLSTLRHLAVAAHLAGDPVMAWQYADRLAGLAEAPRDVVDCLIRLSTLQFIANRLDATTLAEHLQACIDRIADDMAFGQLGKLLAGVLNNVVSRLLDHPGLDPADPPCRRALLDGAQRCRAIWLRIGNWLNDERSNYLVALCANRVGDWAQARQAAEAALATIAQHGEEDVDRAFILLELARALAALNDAPGAASARRTATVLAEGFNAELRAWFDSKAAS